MSAFYGKFWDGCINKHWYVVTDMAGRLIEHSRTYYKREHQTQRATLPNLKKLCSNANFGLKNKMRTVATDIVRPAALSRGQGHH